MRRLGIAIAIGAALYVVFTLAFPTYTHRYRLTIDIETPEGVRSGSSVMEVSRRDERWVVIAQGRYTFHRRGEGVFVDLGAGRSVIAIMAHGARGEDVDQMISLPIEAYGHYKWDEGAWSHRKKLAGRVELKPPLIPTLVTFSDLSNTKTAEVVYATTVQETNDGRSGPRRTPRVAVDRLSEKFGHGVTFGRAWLEATSDPITSNIESRMPNAIGQLREQAKVLRVVGPRTPYTPGLGHFLLK